MSVPEALRKYARRKYRGPVHRIFSLFIEARAHLKYLTSSKHDCAKKFVIWGPSGRSGSTLLADLINSLPTVTCHGELLHDPLIAPELYIKRHLAVCEAEAFGFKLLPYHLAVIQRMDSPMSFLQELISQGYEVIHLRRENMLKVVLSSNLARAKQKWHYHGKTHLPVREKMRFDVSEVLSGLRQRATYYREERGFMENSAGLKLTYERDLEAEERHPATVSKVADFLEVPFVPPKTDLQKGLSRNIADIVENYDELAAALKGTEFENYLG